MHTLVCASALGLSGLAGQAIAHDPIPEDERLTNSVVLQWEEVEQRLWLRGLALGIASGISLADSDTGACVSDWYFDDEAQSFANVRANMERFPDHLPQAVIAAMARRACPELSEL